MRQMLTVIIHTKNEATNISSCIHSIRSIASEIIVADMHSQDATQRIGKRLGAKIVTVKTDFYADPARNKILKLATFPWILVLDADERVTSKVRKIISTVIQSNEFDVVNFPYKNIMMGKWIRHSMRWPDYHPRLFKKGFVRWPKKVHGDVQVSGKVLTLPANETNAIIHYNVMNLDQLIEKMNRYTNFEFYYEGQTKIRAIDVYNRISDEFRWRHYEHLGYLDGMHGFITNKCMEFYRFLEFAKYWERQGYPEIFSTKEIDKFWKPVTNRGVESQNSSPIKSQILAVMQKMYDTFLHVF